MKKLNENHGFWFVYMWVCGLIIGAGLVGCWPTWFAAHPHPTTVNAPDVVMEVLDPACRPFALSWQREIQRRFHNAVGVMFHGNEHIAFTWDTSVAAFGRLATVSDIIAVEKARYPDRTIVLIACNPGHLKLGIPGVYYAPDNVWITPDRDAMGEEDAALRSVFYPNYVGNIFEFITD